MDTVESHPKTRSRPFPLWRRILYLIMMVAQAILITIQGNHLDKSHHRELEYARQISTLVAENRRVREHCPQEETQQRSGILARR